MPKKLLVAGLLAFALSSTSAWAEPRISIQLGLPRVLPPLVEVEPGVRIVQDFDEEIFFIGGYYWVQRDGAWYRARDHRGSWRYVGPDRLPPTLLRREPGRYRRWQHDERRAWPEAGERGRARHWRPHDYRERREQPGERGPERRGERREERGEHRGGSPGAPRADPPKTGEGHGDDHHDRGHQGPGRP